VAEQQKNAQTTEAQQGHPKFHKQFLESFGPGMIAGAADDDPSGIATYSVAGAQTGTSLLWTALFTWPLMGAVQMMCARIGMVTGRGLTAALKEKFPNWLVITAIAALLAANTINIGADLAGMADAGELLTHISSHIWVVVFAVVISWATIRLRYAQIAHTLKWLCLALFAYVATAFIVKIDWHSAVHDTFIPSLPHGKDGWQMVVAILGTTISPYLFFWQAIQEVEEEKAMGRKSLRARQGATRNELRIRRYDVGIGTFFSNLVMYFIILVTAATLHAAGKTQIETARDAAQALQPLAGRFAAALFTLGLVGVGFLAIPTLTGSAAYAFAENFGWRQGLDRKLKQARAFYAIVLASTIVGLAMNFSHMNPVKALYWSAVINGVLAPFVMAALLYIAIDAKLMKQQPSSRLSLIVVFIATVAMFAAAIAMFVL